MVELGELSARFETSLFYFMKTPNTNNSAWLAPYLAGALLLIYVAVRAALMSFTHDESLTYTILKGDETWVFTGNHHVLNSILAKGSALLFGYSELALRLPNVLAFAAYFISSNAS
jgi:hypothetical protein